MCEFLLFKDQILKCVSSYFSTGAFRMKFGKEKGLGTIFSVFSPKKDLVFCFSGEAFAGNHRK
ncbi:hypothetical protein CH380_13780 [Leptospira adleri]|uniref:Uncharacterized protein n=1 Tax=Leptospira adleri TaxID=2023186 RepID=A0A2M9YLY0_9LEPT|nr:hypothetical protein CH380_13780 [Leptospira adleri]PJZ60866.1 hypothetical protein CH376_16235 [Leptospira adleri]